MSIDAVITECDTLVAAYVQAMRGQGRAHARGDTHSPEHSEAKAAFLRLTMKTEVLNDHGRCDISLRFLADALKEGSAASIESQRAALREMVTP